MDILVLGGTKFFGIPMVQDLLKKGHSVTIATRGNLGDEYGDSVSRIIVDHSNPDSMKKAFAGMYFDVVIDKIAYCSNDIKYAMESLDFGRYIHMSSTAVYDPKYMGVKESDFDGGDYELYWSNRVYEDYSGMKRLAEAALCQVYNDRKWVAVRYPVVLGINDYTKRLLFYVEHVMKEIPMNVDNLDYSMGYIHEEEAGKFMSYLVDTDFEGPVNGSSHGTITIREILNYVEEKTGKCAIIDNQGDAAPYNGEVEFSIDTQKAEELGFAFSDIHDWIFELLDNCIKSVVA